MRPVSKAFQRLSVLSLICLASPAFGDVTPILTVRGHATENRAEATLVDGPLRADQSVLGLRLDGASVAALVQRRAEPIRYNVGQYYREIRGFDDPKLKISVVYESDATLEHFEAIDGRDVDVELRLTDFVRSINLSIVGTDNEYKCFDADTCAFVSSYEGYLYVVFDKTVAVASFEPILACGENDQVTIESYIARPETQRAIIKNDSIKNYLGIDSIIQGTGEAAATGPAFKGFGTSIGSYGSYYNPSGSYRRVDFFRDHGGLKIKVETKAHYFCQYVRNTGSYPDYFSVPVRIGQPCPYFDFNTRVSGSRGGADQDYSQDWFLGSCRNIKTTN